MAGATWPGCACRTGKLIGSERWIKLEPVWIERLIRAALARLGKPLSPPWRNRNAGYGLE